MLRQYFDRRGLLGALVWDDLADAGRNTVYAAWQALPQRSRDAVGVDFQNVAGLATMLGVQIILEEGRFQRVDLVPELTKLPSHSEKAFHVLLNHPRVFRVASQFNYADNLNRFFLTCSLGLLAPPSSHDSTLPTVTVCSSSGALTRILNVSCPKGHLRKSAAPERGHGLDSGLVRDFRLPRMGLATRRTPRSHHSWIWHTEGKLER